MHKMIKKGLLYGLALRRAKPWSAHRKHILEKRSRAQALVEFALVFPLVLLLVFVALQVLQIGLAQTILSSAAGEAARSASVHNDRYYVNTLLDGVDFGLRTRQEAVDTVVNTRVRRTLPMLANTTATLSAVYQQAGDHQIAVQDVVTLEVTVPVLPFIPASNITIRAVGRAFRSDWVGDEPILWVPNESCFIGAELSSTSPRIGVDTLSLNIHSADHNGTDTASQTDVTWFLDGQSGASCSGSGDYSCSGPQAVKPTVPQAYADVKISASACNSGSEFEMRLPFFPR